MFEYKITGQITYNEAETEEGRDTVDLVETVEVDDMSAGGAFKKFLDENEQYEFYGNLKTVDAETGGKKGATYCDQNEDQTIEVELVAK